MSSSTRPDWDETWMAVARTVALRSLCQRDKVGAVVVSKSNRLLETGYNGPPSGYKTDGVGCSSWCTRGMYTTQPCFLAGEHCSVHRQHASRCQAGDFTLSPTYTDCPSLHAEANALMRGERSAREGGTIYVTSGMCWGCAKLVANSGLIQVVIDGIADVRQYRDTEKSYRFLESCGLTVVTG